ncbi:CD63 antigen-like [Trichogramma pretiosum]|uniref:CD63 antigen-like n=1 Tax=Trichogramma pretiosum TaxID=7493 RepID=UPI0006C959C0|nr:CD63 antigen-like [Trichogramma pretiosum]XP_014238879.1 CD63 antigen-like [Trichogramma pretiosum]
MGCASGCVRWLLFLFNFLFALGGLAILASGVAIRVNLSDYEQFKDTPVSVIPASLLITIGAIIFVIAFFGCCGALRESYCMIIMFALLLILLLIAQVSAGAYAFVKFKDSNLEEKFNEGLEKSYLQYFTGPTQIKDGIDAMQGLVECCGYNGPNEFPNLLGNDKHIIPGSCCRKYGEEDADVCSPNEAFRKSCKEEVFPFLMKYAVILAALCISVAFIELIGVIFAFCLASSVRNAERGYKV